MRFWKIFTPSLKHCRPQPTDHTFGIVTLGGWRYALPDGVPIEEISQRSGSFPLT